MRKILMLLYGSTVYAMFGGVFLYAMAFIGDIAVPHTINRGGPEAPLAEALAVNALLLSLFAIQHSVMARKAFKKVLTRFVPKEMERSTFVLATNLVLILMFWQWRPMPTTIWELESPLAAGLLYGVSAIGWGVVLMATIYIHHFDLFGMRQTWLAFRGKPYEDIGFRTPGLYKVVRHPIQVGFLIAFWATPVMTAGHLLFAVMCTGYILFAVKALEERDLLKEFPEQYRAYMDQVGGFLPLKALAARSGNRRSAEVAAVTGD